MKSSNAGLIGANIYFFDTVLHRFVYAPTYWPEQRIWFEDSMVIQERDGIHVERNQLGIEKRWVTVDKFTFIDLRDRSFYDYTSLSDTAKLIKKYTQPDSVGISGGWNFYYLRKTDVQSYRQLSDTTIDGIQLKRMALTLKFVGHTTSTIDYFRCDKKGTMFQIDNEFSTKIGCPIVREDETSGKHGSVSRRTIFLRDSLTSVERQVFAAWKKYAKENPVLKN